MSSAGEVAPGRRSSSSLRRAPSSALRKLRRAAAVSASAAAILRTGQPNVASIALIAPPSPTPRPVSSPSTATRMPPEKVPQQRNLGNFQVPTVSAGQFLDSAHCEVQEDGCEEQRLSKRDDFAEHGHALPIYRKAGYSSTLSASYSEVHEIWKRQAHLESSVQSAGGVLYTSLPLWTPVPDESLIAVDEEEAPEPEWHDCD